MSMALSLLRIILSSLMTGVSPWSGRGAPLAWRQYWHLAWSICSALCLISQSKSVSTPIILLFSSSMRRISSWMSSRCRKLQARSCGERVLLIWCECLTEYPRRRPGVLGCAGVLLRMTGEAAILRRGFGCSMPIQYNQQPVYFIGAQYKMGGSGVGHLVSWRARISSSIMILMLRQQSTLYCLWRLPAAC